MTIDSETVQWIFQWSTLCPVLTRLNFEINIWIILSLRIIMLNLLIIIMVGIQYRVASLGFLYFEEEDVPGNAGMYDQLEAIRWVKNNIAKFGGNPNNITLMGESAGACSVSLHLLSPLSRNLFSQAIMQSASATVPWGVITKEESLIRGLRLAELMNCPHDK